MHSRLRFSILNPPNGSLRPCILKRLRFADLLHGRRLNRLPLGTNTLEHWNSITLKHMFNNFLFGRLLDAAQCQCAVKIIMRVWYMRAQSPSRTFTDVVLFSHLAPTWSWPSHLGLGLNKSSKGEMSPTTPTRYSLDERCEIGCSPSRY